MKTTRRGRSLGLAFIAILLITVPVVAKHKDDVITFRNGDRLTGEIKSLDHGQLYFKNPSLYETVRLDWAQIAKVESKDQYIVELTSGARLEGFLSKPANAESQPEVVQITGDNKGGAGPVQVSRQDIIGIRPSEGSFWRQVKGSLDVGFSFSQGSAQTNFNLESTTEYVARRYAIYSSLDSSFSGQSKGTKTSRIDWTLTGRYFLNRKWFVPVYSEFQTSSQQQLDLRTTLGSGAGRVLKLTNKTAILGFGGVVVNRERYAPESGLTPRNTEVESMAGLYGTTYKFDKLEGDSGLVVFSRPGRMRVNFRAGLRWKLVSKLYWKIGFYENFDSSPPTATRKNDFGTSSSIGWKF